jgi:hypothetical protein
MVQILGGGGRRRKAELLDKISKLDKKKAEECQLDSEEWALRYEVEGELAQVYRREELYWQVRWGGGGSNGF